VIKFLVHANDTEKKGKSNKINDIILNSSLILEAFGNAKTVQNHNSSRFGKYIKLQYTKNLELVSAETSTFLLEKSRLVSVGRNERNYHVFYRLLRGIDSINPNISRELQLGAVDSFKILTSGGATIIQDESEDVRDFMNLYNALKEVGCTEVQINGIWKIIAAILHLGNAVYTAPDVEGKSVMIDIPTSSVAHVSSLLGLDEKELKRSLTSHLINTRHGASIKIKLLNLAESSNNVCGMMKRLYHCIFSWILRTVNDCCQDTSITDSKIQTEKYIGILDIFGFGKHVE